MSDPSRDGMTYQLVVIIGRPAGLLGDPLEDFDESAYQAAFC